MTLKVYPAKWKLEKPPSILTNNIWNAIFHFEFPILSFFFKLEKLSNSKKNSTQPIFLNSIIYYMNHNTEIYGELDSARLGGAETTA